MEIATNLSDQPRSAACASCPVERRTILFPLALQIGLLWFALALLWFWLGPEPSDARSYCLRYFAVGSGCFLSLASWIISSGRSFALKVVAIISSLTAIALVGYVDCAAFDRTIRVLEPADVVQGRVFHRSLGVSYAPLPGSVVDLERIVAHTTGTRTNNNQSLPQEDRLRHGDVATVCRMTPATQTQEMNRVRWSIVLQIQRYRLPEFNAFIVNVRRMERNWTGIPNIKVIRSTHVVTFGGHDFAEFDLLDKSKGVVSRHVCLKRGDFLLDVIMNLGVESDERLFNDFDDFLNSFRIE